MRWASSRSRTLAAARRGRLAAARVRANSTVGTGAAVVAREPDLRVLATTALTLDAGLGDRVGDQLDRADRVVVARDDVLDQVRIAVGVGQTDTGMPSLLASLTAMCSCCGSITNSAAGVPFMSRMPPTNFVRRSGFAAQVERFFLGERVERAVFVHLRELAQTLDADLHGAEVGQRAAQPTAGDVELPRAHGLFDDHVLGLALGADEQQLAAARHRSS